MSDMIPFKLLISYEEALKIIQKTLCPIERIEEVPIEKALNRVLAKNLIAGISVPPFPRAAMDGYAVRAKETFSASASEPKQLKLVDVVHAGEHAARALEHGECVQVATGSPIPKNADAVVMVEYTTIQDGEIEFLRPVYPGSNISPEGEDIKKGTTILTDGDILVPAKVGVMAALGLTHVKIYAKPRVAVTSTGSEICDVGLKLKPGQIYDVNSYTLFTILQENGANPVRHPTVNDDFEEIKSLIKDSLDYDMIVLSGGSSVGERDLLYRVVEEMEKLGWYKIKKPREGAVLIWEKQKYGNEQFGHIGFYIGRNKAISNSTSARTPRRHHWTFGGKRKVEAIYWHRKLRKSK